MACSFREAKPTWNDIIIEETPWTSDYSTTCLDEERTDTISTLSGTFLNEEAVQQAQHERPWPVRTSLDWWSEWESFNSFLDDDDDEAYPGLNPGANSRGLDSTAEFAQLGEDDAASFQTPSKAERHDDPGTGGLRKGKNICSL
mmetsp:Transcript_15796/g.45313  ORF Transcript_15796/g.45313 Transcript_15796/m.45313 type:complete len:144 (-) Transcript_15796:393-824(-)